MWKPSKYKGYATEKPTEKPCNITRVSFGQTHYGENSSNHLRRELVGNVSYCYANPKILRTKSYVELPFCMYKTEINREAIPGKELCLIICVPLSRMDQWSRAQAREGLCALVRLKSVEPHRLIPLPFNCTEVSVHTSGWESCHCRWSTTDGAFTASPSPVQQFFHWRQISLSIQDSGDESIYTLIYDSPLIVLNFLRIVPYVLLKKKLWCCLLWLGEGEEPRDEVGGVWCDFCNHFLFWVPIPER